MAIGPDIVIVHNMFNDPELFHYRDLLTQTFSSVLKNEHVPLHGVKNITCYAIHLFHMNLKCSLVLQSLKVLDTTYLE